MNWFAKKPFRALMISMMVVAVLPLLLNSLCYFRFQGTVRKQQEALIEQSLRFSVQQIDNTFMQLTTSGMKLAEEFNSLNIPNEDEMTVSDRMQLWSVRKSFEDELGVSSEYISAIYMFSTQSRQAVGTSGVMSEDSIYQLHYKKLGVPQERMEALHRSYYNSKLVVLEDNTLAFVRSMGRQSDNTPKNQLVFLLKESFYRTLIVNNNVENAVFVLVNNKGRVLAVSNKTGRELDDNVIASICEDEPDEDFTLFGDSARLFSVKSTVGGYSVRAAVPYSQLLNELRDFYRYYLLMLGAAIALSIILAVFFSRRNTMPINRLIEYIQNNYADDAENTQGLEKIKTAVDSLLSQRRTDREQLERYETDISRFCLQASLQGIAAGDGSFEIPPNESYVVACFTTQQPCTEDDNALISQSRAILSDGYLCHSILLDGVVVQVLGSHKADWNEEAAEGLLTAQMSWLDRQNGPTYTAAYSAVHSGAEALGRAYGEAGIALNFADRDTVIASFSNCRFRSSALLRDWHHLDKQLLFSRTVGEGRYDEALQILPGLFPAEFLDEYFMGSDISKLHLSSLKYQFLHDLDIMSVSDTQWTEITQEMLHCKNHRSLYNAIKEQLELLVTENTEPKPRQESNENSRISEVKNYIKQNYADPQLSVSSVADNFGLSANTLSQLFRRKSEIGVLDYIHSVRIEKAAELLRETPTLTVGQIAEATGYASVLTFNRKFKASYNMTPAEYRKSFTNEI